MSRIEKILQAMIDETSYDETPQSRIEAILLAIKNNTQYSDLPYSRIEEILLAIKNNTSYDKEPMSRIEEILLAILNSVEYKKPVQSKIEKLLLKWLYQDLYLTLKGVPPLTFTTNGQPLVDWTIYGNTINGESVGDRTANLFDVELTDDYHLDSTTGLPVAYNYRFATLQPIAINQSEYCLTYNSTTDLRFMYSVFNNETLIRRVVRTNGRYLKSGDVVDTTDGNKIYFAFFCSDYSEASTGMISNIMLNTGSTPLPYEPYGYRVPVTVTNGTDTETTNIYLPEQIKMVGDEAEYVDYAEQKQHRVRKNLLRNTASTKKTQDYSFVVDNDGTITIDGYFTNTYDFAINGTWNSTEEIIKQGNYTLSNVGDSITSNIRVIAYNLKVNKGFLNENTSSALITNSAVTYVAIQIPSGTHINNLKLKMMICKAEITDDTYEPYIENTELDVTLPALPTLSGTNTLSVGTQVQPSNMEIIYAPKEPELKLMMKKN